MTTYHEDREYLSKSFLVNFKLSAAHALNYMVADKKDTEAMKFGRIYHANIARLEKEYFVLDPDQRPEPDKTFASNLNKAWKQNIEAVEKDVIMKEDYMVILEMIEKLKQNETVKKINAFELIQEDVFKTEIEGRKIKCKPDGLQIHRGATGENLVIDWKTCSTVEPDTVTRELFKYSYDVQAAMYCDIITALKGGESNMLFIFQEKSAPYDVLPVLVSANSYAMQNGRNKYQKYYDEAIECFRSNVWPGIASKYPEKCLIIE